MAQPGIRGQLGSMTSDQGRLVGLVGAELVLVAGLHALSRADVFAVGWSGISDRFRDLAFEDAVGSAVLLVALGLAYWLLLSTVAYLAASLSGRPAVTGAVRWLTVPPIRRLVSRAVVLSLAASAFAAPLAPAVATLAGGGSAAEVIVELDGRGQLHPPGVDKIPAAGAEPSDVIVPPHLRAPPAPDPVDDGGGNEALPTPPLEGWVVHTVTVRRGDHLWSLSDEHLRRVWNRTSLGQHEIAPYWVQVIEANRGSIRSGDADLIYPGEVITLPIVDQ